MAKSILLVGLLLMAGCGMDSNKAQEPPVVAEQVFDAYRAYKSEFTRLRRLPYADRDLALFGSMATTEWAAVDAEFLFEQPETIEMSQRDLKLEIRLMSLSDHEAVLSVCRKQWTDLLYVETGDRIGGGRSKDVGSVVTMRLIDGDWLVGSDQFDQRKCNRD